MAGIYIHIPFCHSKCSYCDFYSTPADRYRDEYIDALIAEMSLRFSELNEPVTTVYIGGGTPSILPVSSIARITRSLSRHISVDALDEFTIEVNPEDVTPDLVADYRSLGVNRISMGVQSFSDERLRLIGRRHDADCARRALSVLSYSGVNYSADLIYGLPDQTLDDWRTELDELLSYAPPHFSSYLLSYEQGTRLYAMLMSGKVTEADEQLAERMYSYLCEAARSAGYQHYEISSFAKPGRRAIHNTSYWNFTPYLGLGVAAHSFDGSLRRFNPKNIADYIKSVSAGKTYYVEEDEAPTSQFNDAVITGLRTSDGLSLSRLRTRFAPHLVSSMLDDARPLIADGRLIHSGDALIIPERHWLISDSIMLALIR